jgi:hypothetical protein
MERLEQLRRGGNTADLFRGQTPPPGAVTVQGRSVVGAIENGNAGAIALIAGVNDQNVRKEIGLTDTEANSIQLLRMQMLMNAPKYASQFQGNMTEESQAKLQADLDRDLAKITESLNNTLPQERMDKVQKLAFQSLGGLDSPIINLNSMEVLKLSDDQKGKMGAIFDEMREERLAQMEKALAMAEKVVAAGGLDNMSPEERAQLEKERQELEAQGAATAKKLAERLRRHLTAEQLAMEKKLIAERPDFLPRLPKHMQAAADQKTQAGDGYTPGVDLWRPGQPLLVQLITPPQRGRFPRTAPTTE